MVKKSNYIEYLALHLKEMLAYNVIFSSGGDIDTLKKRKQQIGNLLSVFNELIKEIALNNDAESLRLVLNELRQFIVHRSIYDSPLGSEEDGELRRVDELKRELYKFRDEVNIEALSIPMGVYFFVLFSLIYNEEFTPDKSVLDQLRELAFKIKAPLDLVLNYYNQPESRNDWNNWLWSLGDRLSGVAYTVDTVEDFLVTGFILDQIRTIDGVQYFPPDSQKRDNLRFFIDQAIDGLNRLDNPYWMKKLRMDEEAYKKNKDIVSEFLQKMKKSNEAALLTKIAEADINAARVNSFRDYVVSQWRKNQNIDKIFKYYDSVAVNPDQKLVNLLPDVYAMDLKRIFLIESNSMFDMLEFGKELGRAKENLLGYRIMQANLPMSNESSVVKGIEKGINVFTKDNEKKIIVISFSNKLHPENGELNNSGKYISAARMQVGGYPFDLIGIYNDSIPIVSMKSSYLHDVIIVTELKKCIQLLQRENEQWIDKKLQIEVQQIKDDDVPAIYEKRKKLYGEELSEEVKLKIKNAVFIKIDEICDFKIIDTTEMYGFRWTWED